MNTSDAIEKIVPAYIKACAAVGPAVKGTENSFFNSKYADLSAVYEACGDALSENDLAVFQTVATEPKALITRLYHTSGEWMETSVPLIVAKDDMQGLGSAITYARRYGLMCALGIAPEDDDGNAAAKGKSKEAANIKRAEGIHKEIAAFIQETDDPETLRQGMIERGYLGNELEPGSDVEKIHQARPSALKNLIAAYTKKLQEMNQGRAA